MCRPCYLSPLPPASCFQGQEPPLMTMVVESATEFGVMEVVAG